MNAAENPESALGWSLTSAAESVPVESVTFTVPPPFGFAEKMLCVPSITYGPRVVPKTHATVFDRSASYPMS